MQERYHPEQIEPRWQARWSEDRLYEAEVDPDREKYYFLTMLPYTSGDMHIGHWFAMTPSDARARYLRMRGYNVTFPIGFDAFGLPAENAAIARDIHPKEWTFKNIENQQRQLRSMGAMWDWSRDGGFGRSGLLSLDPMVLPAISQERPGIQEGLAGGLVPQLQHHPGP